MPISRTATRQTLRLSLGLALGLAAALPLSAQTLTIYSGRGEALVGPLIAQFEADTGIDTEVRYGSTSEMATLLMEEGEASPADLFWAQDAGALGALVDRFAELPAELNASVLSAYHNDANRWIALSGRTRVLVHSTERVTEADLPASIFDLTQEAYRGRVAWAPTNGSFQAFVTAMRVSEGEGAAREWLEGMIANDARVYRNNGTQIEAIANGEVDFGLVNNYYLGRYVGPDPEFPVGQTHFQAGDIGNLALLAGAGILATADAPEQARAFIDYMLSPVAQQYIALQGNEYPVINGVIVPSTLEAVSVIDEISPQVDINQLGDLEGTLTLLRDVGLL